MLTFAIKYICIYIYKHEMEGTGEQKYITNLPPVLVFFAKPFHSQRVKQTVYKQVIVLVVMNATALIRYSVTWDAKEHHLHIAPGCSLINNAAHE